MLKIWTHGRRFCSQTIKMKWLNVAEKNDAAKNIASLLSNGSSVRREGLSKFNKIYQFAANVQGQPADMIMTSVSGHLLTYEFGLSYNNWQAIDPITLFNAPVSKLCPSNFQPIRKTIEREIRACDSLIIWTDCDREGENIGFEIIDVCRAIKPQIQVYRAIFSEITTAAVKRALANLKQPDILKSQAVDVRSELDLRIGAAFTRYQTMRYQRLFPLIDKKIVSYGSCQIPTLGFVTNRFKENEQFIPQTFWKLIMNHKINDLMVDFQWNRNRLFDKQCCEAFLMVCEANSKATITSIIRKPKNKWRPVPMDTIELEKLGSRKLKISAKQTMTIAEKLYQQGFISYPRTETNQFSADVNLRSLLEQCRPDPNYGSFAQKVLDWGPNPRNGSKSDQAHPPIHPTKYTNNLTGDEGRVYELIVRHFLACVSRDATGSETIVNATIVDEEFTATGLIIHERNYLEVYIYDKWNGKELHPYEQGNQFDPTELAMKQGQTTAPQMLTEAELIALMDKHGIGTDATHAEHINTIKERSYIGEERGFLIPGILGLGLVEGYESINLPLAEPKLRAALEKDLKRICDGLRQPADVLREQIQIYKEVFEKIIQSSRTMDTAIAGRLSVQPVDAPEPQPTNQFQEVHKCPHCSSMIALKTTAENRMLLSCLGFPACKQTMWLPQEYFKEAVLTTDECPNCGSGFKKIKLKLKSMHLVSFLNANNVEGLHYVTCVACDRKLKDLCGGSHEQQNNANATAIGGGNNTTLNGMVAESPSANDGYINPNTRNYRNGPNTSRNNQSNSSHQRNINANIDSANHDRFANSNNRNNTNSRSTNSKDENYKCPTCGTLLKPMTVVKQDTGNAGRQFYKCCGTFQWADQIATSSSTRTAQNTAGPSNNATRYTIPSGNNTEDVKCSVCGKSAVLRTVMKETANKGKKFYGCSTTCNFFKWADELPVRIDGPSTSAASRSGNSRSRPINSDDPSRPRAKRKCGICGEEGHIRTKCPRQ